MSAKKTAFSDVKNLMGTANTPGQIAGKQSGLKKPVFGSQYKGKIGAKPTIVPVEKSAPVQAKLKRKTFKPSIDQSSIDYSDSVPHTGCKPSGQRDILFDFWSAASSNFSIYQDTAEPRPTLRSIDLPDLSFMTPTTITTPRDLAPPFPNLFDDLPDFPSFNDL